ncbi:MAG: hypothetical protein LUP96_07335 [Methylococcaceae bacterium]|nr:hypothetical protein [Methylococcaceae bacterium]
MQADPIYTSEHFAVLSFDGLQLLIPQNDIYSLEPIVDITPSADNSSLGQLQQGSQVWSLYALSSDLTLLTSRPDSYHIVILMKNVQPAFGLLCEQVQTIERSQIRIHPVPPAMNCKNSPLLALALTGEEVRCISSASALSDLFPH